MPDRGGDVGSRQRCGGDLVQKWLKEVVVAPVNDRHVHRRFPKCTRRLQATKAASENDHVWWHRSSWGSWRLFLFAVLSDLRHLLAFFSLCNVSLFQCPRCYDEVAEKVT